MGRPVKRYNGGSGTSGEGNAGGSPNQVGGNNPPWGRGGGGGGKSNAGYATSEGTGQTWHGTEYARGGQCGANSASPDGNGNGGGSRFSAGGSGHAAGDGTVIIRYSGAQRGNGGTVTSSGGYTYHTFTSSGTYTS